MPAETTKRLSAMVATLPPEYAVVTERLSVAMEHVASAQEKQSELMEKMGEMLASIDDRVRVFEAHEITQKVHDHDGRLIQLETAEAVRRSQRAMFNTLIMSNIIPWLVIVAGSVFMMLYKVGVWK